MKMFLLIAPLGVMLTTTMSASAQGYPDAGIEPPRRSQLRLCAKSVAARVRRLRRLCGKLPSNPRAYCLTRRARNL